MEATVDAIIVIDHRGKMQAVNGAASRIFGYQSNELLGENVSLLMPEPDRADHDSFLKEYLKTGIAKIIGIGREVIAQRKDGSTFPARLSVGRIPDRTRCFIVGLSVGLCAMVAWCVRASVRSWQRRAFRRAP